MLFPTARSFVFREATFALFCLSLLWEILLFFLAILTTKFDLFILIILISTIDSRNAQGFKRASYFNEFREQLIDLLKKP